MDVPTHWPERLGQVVSPTGGTAAKQLYFVSFVLVTTLVIAFSHAELVRTPTYLAALGVLAAATILAMVINWDVRRGAWLALVPVMDIAAVALLRDVMRDSSIAVSLLVFIPALWLAARLRLPGVVVSVVAATVLIVVPAFLRAPNIDSLTIAHGLLLPFTLLQIGLLAVGALRLLDGKNRHLAATLKEKNALLDGAATSEQLLKNIIDSVDVGIVVVDRDGDDVLMNRAQHRIHALSAPKGVDDPNEQQLLIHYPGTTTPIPADQRAVRRAVLQETFSNYIVAVGPPGPDAPTFSASARQILDQHGERSGAVVVFSDVTSYIQTVRSQERFVASVSHELRTPLTSVIGYLELARDDLDLSRETASYLEVAHRNAEQLLVIVQDLLAEQVTRSRTQDLTLRPHRLSEIAAASADSFVPKAEAAGITLVREIEETPELALDATRMQQCVDNLLSNAVKYTPRGGTVRVHTCVRESHAELNVIDTGIGMSDEEQTNLFTEYYRTETARHSTIEGHGLGLSLTRRIVVAHGGQISVRSRPGEGSTFTIRFGLEEAEERSAERTDTRSAHA